MVKRCIGIDIGSSCLRAVQVSRTGEHFNIEKVFSIQTRRDSDSPPEILRSLTSKYGFDRRADVAISMPNDAVFYRNLETDVTGLEQICGLSKRDPKREKEHLQTQSVLEHNFPIEPNEIVAQVCSYRQPSSDKYSVLVAAVKRASLHERMNILAEAKMHPNLVEAAIFAVHSAITVNHPEIMTGQAIIAYVDESYLTLAVTENNNILIVRNIPIVSSSDNNADSAQKQIAEVLSREVEITWQKVFETAIQEDTKIYLVSKDNVSNDLEATIAANLPCQTTVVNSYEKVECSAQGDGDSEISLAKGLALRVLVPDRTAGINFREADTAKVKPTLDLKKEFITCAILLTAIAVVSLLGLFLQLSYLERKYAHIKNEITQVFKAALPEEKNIVSPLAQLEQELQSLRKDYRFFAPFSPTDSRPLDVLRSLTLNTPSQGNVKIDDLLITPESVRLNGTCDSFESVYQWQRLLQKIPGFPLVDVPYAQKEPKSGAVHFTIVVSSVIPEQK
ncbi:MAG: pilus assembly protein PilM [Phycisphaerae bacterium]